MCSSAVSGERQPLGMLPTETTDVCRKTAAPLARYAQFVRLQIPGGMAKTARLPAALYFRSMAALWQLIGIWACQLALRTSARLRTKASAPSGVPVVAPNQLTLDAATLVDLQNPAPMP